MAPSSFWFVALALLSGVTPALAQLPPGLPVPPENFAAPHFFGSPSAISIRHLGLGGAYVGDNRSGWHGNPAGLVALRQPMILFSHNAAGFDSLPTFRTNFLGYAQPFGSNGENVFKISGITVRADGMATGGAAPLGFDSSEDDLAIEFAHRVNERLSVGIGTAYLRTETMYSVAGVGVVTALRSRPSTLGGRVGLVYDLNSRLSFGATYDHYIERVERSVPVLSTPIESFRFRSEGYRIGMAYRPDSNTTLLADYEDLSLTGNGKKMFGRSLLLGAERSFGPLSLRVGSYDGRLTGGLGFKRGQFDFAYAFTGRYDKNLPNQGARTAHAFQVMAAF